MYGINERVVIVYFNMGTGGGQLVIAADCKNAWSCGGRVSRFAEDLPYLCGL